MPPRILHIDSGNEWRGGQRQVFLLARGLRDQGHEPLVIASPGSPLVQRLRESGVATSGIRMRAEWDLIAVRKMRTIIRTWRPDVIHAHDARTHGLALAALVGRPTIPLVVTRRLASPPRGMRLKFGARVSRFVATSGAVLDALVAGGVAPERITVVHPGVPARQKHQPRNWRTECRWPPESIVCGVIGPGADGPILTHIAEYLPPSVRRRVRLVVMSGRSTGADRIGGVESFRAGHVEERTPALAGLDMLWHLSGSDGLASAVIDAMTLHVPPIAFAVGALPELIEHERSGLLVPENDAAAFAREVTRLIDEPELLQTMAAHGPGRAAQFSAQRMVLRLEKLYLDLLGNSAGKPPVQHAGAKW
jgi:L-malate glycosyltransferase